MASTVEQGNSGGRSAISRLLAAIGYPDRMSMDGVSFTLRVDGVEILAEETEGWIVLSCVLSNDESMLAELAVYASGRILKENAVLSYGRRATVDERPSVFLWQDAPSSSSDGEFVWFFETFMNSCDWWRARVEALRGEASAESAPEAMVIRP